MRKSPAVRESSVKRAISPAPADQRRGSNRGSAVEAVASVAQRLAVLLAAGVAPTSTWGYLAEQPVGSASAMLTAIAEGARSGAPVAKTIVNSLGTVLPADAAPWRSLAAAWHVATVAGAPLAPTLREFAASLRNLAQIQRELHVALAAPTATARLVTGLPLVAIIFGAALGFDPLGTLFGTTPGRICLGTGVLLMVLARRWNRWLLARAQPRGPTPGLTLELMAIALAGGVSIDRATAMMSEAQRSCGVAESTDDRSLVEVLQLSRRAGVPASALLRSEAEEARRKAKSEGDRRAATLSITLMLPLGICILPAFMLLGVAPLVISVITSTVNGL